MIKENLSSRLPFSTATGNLELGHECWPQQLRNGIARMKVDKDTEEEGKKIRVNKERSTAGTKQRCPEGLTVAPAYSPSKSLLPEAMDELLNWPIPTPII